MKRLLIRADGGKGIGMGHWSRCLFLASCYKAVEPDLLVTLFTRNKTEFFQSFPEEILSVAVVDQEESFIKEIAPGDVVLLDLYGIERDYFEAICKREAFLIFVDDLMPEGLVADVVINHSLGIKPSDYVAPAPFTSFYLGGLNCLIADSFTPVKEEKDKRIKQLLLCMGGGDPGNVTLELSQKYEASLREYEKVVVVLGPHYPDEEGLKAYSQKMPNVHVAKGLSKYEVNQLMHQCGVAILPASTMAVEYAQVGGVLGIIQTAENQEKLYSGLLKEKVAIALEEVLEKKQDINLLYSELLEEQRKVYDGLSHERFYKLFREIASQQEIALRKAVKEDLEITFQWATDSKVRVFSFSTGEIGWNNHQQWFLQKIADEGCVYFIAQVGSQAVGSIRFDIKGKEATISYLIDSKWHGRGLGRSLLAEGIKTLLKSGKEVEEVVGFVLEENKASLRIFERLGFTRQIEEGKIKYSKKVVYGKDLY